jgi:hypothetical protein
VRVQIGQRLVQQDHTRAHSKAPGESHPLPLPARQLVRLAVGHAGEADHMQRRPDTRLPLG